MIIPARDAAGRLVVRKQVDPADPARDILELRLQNEIRVLAQLNGISGVVPVVESEPLVPTLTLRAADASLDQLLYRGTVLEATARRWAIDLLRTLDAIHNRGVVHRDIKPSNLLVSGSDLWLADFGVATSGSPPRALPDGWEEDSIGTPRWRAPELATNATWQSDPSIDVFGAAKTIAAMLQPASLPPIFSLATATDPRQRPGVGELIEALQRS